MIPSAKNYSRSAETLTYTLSFALVQKVGPVTQKCFQTETQAMIIEDE
jgi:hypothetical protein